MATSEGDPSLDGVYKLVSIESDGEWTPAIKLSDTPAKVINPGRKDVLRLYDRRGSATADILAQEGEELVDPVALYHPVEPGVSRILKIDEISARESLLEAVDPWVVADEREAIVAARGRRTADLDRLDAGVRRVVNPHVYHVSLSQQSRDLKQSLIEEMQTR
jgi:nicotinate phosphoribosyltransferase